MTSTALHAVTNNKMLPTMGNSGMCIIPSGRVTRIKVDSEAVARNTLIGRKVLPIYLVLLADKKLLLAYDVAIDGPSMFSDNMDIVIGCRASIWLETKASVILQLLPPGEREDQSI